ncbi:thiaminase II, partial [Candidatus Bathyarchaeota archaeon]
AEMAEGTLPLERFKEYIRQDYAYLADFARCLGLAAAKADDMETMRIFASLMNGCLTGEVERLEGLSERLGIPLDVLRGTELAPANLAYTRHLLHVAYSGSVGEIVAAMLPCMWSYQIIGERLVESPALVDRPFYHEWASIYSSESYAELVGWYIDMTNRYAEGSGDETRRRMMEHFILSSRYEYLFWEMAYRGEGWEG